jgi:hypothetical protein
MNFKKEYDSLSGNYKESKYKIFDNIKVLSILISLSISLFIYCVYWFCSWQLTIPYKFLFEMNNWNFGQRFSFLFGFPSYQMLIYYSVYAYKNDVDKFMPIMPLALSTLFMLMVFCGCSC